MNKYFFIKNEYIKKFAIAFIILCLFGLYKTAFVLILIFASILFILRQRHFAINDLRLAEPDLILSPVSGVLVHVSKREELTKLIFRVNVYNSAGIYLPVNGEIANTTENKVFITNKKGHGFSITAKGFFSVNKVHLFVIPGDRGVVGGLLGHITLGGKVTLEIPSQCEVMIKKGDRVLSSQTIIAKTTDEIRT